LALDFINEKLEDDAIMEKKIKILYDKLIFLSGRFTKLKKNYFIKINENQGLIWELYCKMIKNLIKAL
jgi:hypothetical protein